MKSHNIDTWFFLEHEPQSFIMAEVQLPSLDGPWNPIKVPGDVNQACVDLGWMPSPHFDCEARKSYWVTSKEWWYKAHFEGIAYTENLELKFETVDGPADVWLNGQYLGLMDNVHRPWSFNIQEKQKEGDNTLLIRFRSIDKLLGGGRIEEQEGWRSRRAFLRKPQYNFGWDWALPLPSIGLAGAVTLKTDTTKAFKEFSIRTYKTGRVDFFFEVTKAAKVAGYEIRIKVKGHGASIKERLVPNSFKSYTSIAIPTPKLWWPNGYGEPSLYDYEVELFVGGKQLDSRKGKLGLREVEVFEEPFGKESGPGFSFGFKVNGVPIFCKGANLCPMEIWPANATDLQYQFVLDKCKESHFNMIRIWGGAIYEREILYDLCDAYGIMVWQDFMFASTGYPVSLLRDSITAEANYQIRRLRNRPCIALWCGCNEDVYSWRHPETFDEIAQSDSGTYSMQDNEWNVNRLKEDPQLHTMLLRGLVSRYGNGVPFTESSPQSYDDAGNAPFSGNSHLSSHKFALMQLKNEPERFREHFNQVCSFDSEFCIHGPTSVASIRKFLAPENHWPPNEAWVYHVQKGHMNMSYHDQIFQIAGKVFGPMPDLPAFVKHGQAMHAEEMRCEFEAARRSRPDCGGTMFWMFNDCWPTSNWSVIDYYRVPKPAYYASKRACAPILPIIMENKGTLEFFISNESSKSVKVKLVVGAEDLEGKQSRKKNKSFLLKANSVLKFDSVLKKKNELRTGSFWFLRAVVDGERLPTVTHFPDGWNAITWPEPGVSFKIVSKKKVKDKIITCIELSTKRFLRMGYIRCSQDDSWMMDNFVDLPSGERITVAIESKRSLLPSQLSVGHWLTCWE